MKNYTTTRKPMPFTIDDTAFTAYPIPGITLLELIEGEVGADGEIKFKADGATIVDLFAKVMQPDEHTRFRAFVEDPSHLVDADLLCEILNDLMEASAGRPTPPPSGSPDGPSTTGTTSTDDSLSPASNPNGSASLVS